MDDLVTQFMAITDAPIRKAETYLRVSDNNLQQAIQLFYETGEADMEDPPTNSTLPPPAPALTPRPGGSEDPIDIDDIEDDDLREALRISEGAPGANAGAAAEDIGDGASTGYDDEALARQLQEELYGGGGGRGGGGDRDGGGVRAPIARTRETLVDDDYGYSDPMRNMSSRRRGAPSTRGIFNQRSTSVWDESEASSAERRYRLLADATGGASESSSKSIRLAEMYRPPFEIISQLSLEDAKTEAREEEKWILVNVQDNTLFTCQTLNRDIWKATEVMATVKENFLFLQMDRNGMDGRDYIRYYLQKAADPSARFDPTVADLFPHIAIIDPRTGEQVKVWKIIPKEPLDFVMQLHEFLERYSLKVDAKNPVQRTSRVKPNVEHMTEDEMMQLAMQNSLGSATSASASTSDDPDALTKNTPDSDLMDFEEFPKGKEPVAIDDEDETPFSRIREDAHHAEPPPGPETTRIQFKMHDGTRVVRRFLLKDRVERLFEYVKADMLPEQEAKKPEEERKSTPGEFGLACLGKKLIEFLDMTVGEAGLRNGTVMVEVMDD